MKSLHMVAWILLVIGGLNWLAVGLFDKGVDALVGASVAKIIYIIVGLAALFDLFTHRGKCKDCSVSGSSMGPKM